MDWTKFNSSKSKKLISGDVCLVNGCPHYLKGKDCYLCKETAQGCAQCGKVPAKFVRINSRPIWRGLQNGRCLSCSLEKEIDIAEVCRDCNKEYEMRIRDVVLCSSCSSIYETLCKQCGERTDVYAEGSLRCPTCFYGDDFVYDTNTEQQTLTRKCNDCGQMDHLNAAGQCKNCYVEEGMAKSQSEDWGSTAVCQKCRKITRRGRKVCVTCELQDRQIKTCRGCMQKFQVISKYDTFCLHCKDKIQKGECTMCGRMDNMASNDRGWCNSCVEEAESEKFG